jgi:hypothetical protein
MKEESDADPEFPHSHVAQRIGGYTQTEGFHGR